MRTAVPAAGDLKIAVVGRYPLRKNYIVGGVEAAIVYLTEELRSLAPMELHVVTLRPEIETPRTVSEDGVTVQYLPASRYGGHITNHLRDRQRMVDCLRQIGPHLVHAHIAGEYAQAAHQSGYPYVLTLHGIRHLEAKLWKKSLSTGVRALLIKRAERACVRRAGHIISISPYVTQEFEGLIRGKVYDIGNPVRQAFFDLNGPGRQGRLLFVGNAGPRKGFLNLLQALASLKEAHLHVAGFVDSDPEFSYRMNEALDAHGVRGRVTFRGSLGEAQLLREYEEASIFVLPSIQETAPVALLEAMAAGRPSVVSRVGGHPYLIDHGRTGLLVEPGDITDLAQALDQLLRNKAMGRQMGENARREAVDRFHVSRLAERTLAVYQEVLDNAWHGSRNVG